MIAIIKSQPITDLYNNIANKLSPGKQIRIEQAKYVSPNFPVRDEQRPRIEDAQISIKKTPTESVEISLKMSPKVDFTFKAEVQQKERELRLGKIIVSGSGQIEIMGKDNPNYTNAEKEIEAALTLDNLNRLLNKLNNPFERIKNWLGFGN